jgi:hypothetical protein
MPLMPKPLIILTADKDALYGVRELVRRPDDLGIGSVEFDCYPHPRHDCGVFKEAHEFLRAFLKWDHAVVLFDREGCGQEDRTCEDLEDIVERRLAANGWDDRAKAVVLAPELECWIWDSSLQVNRVLGWTHTRDLDRWLCERGFPLGTDGKPQRPKEAFAAALRYQNRHPSSALFQDLGKAFRSSGCSERSFLRFRNALQRWFPPV